MTQADFKHLTLVCYKSGYGGDFLCALLNNSLNGVPFDVRDANNRYWGKNYPFKFSDEHIKSLHHIFSYYQRGQSFDLINELSEKVDWAKSIKRIVEICYDEDEDEFVGNLIHMFSSNLNLPYAYNVGNIHYMGEYEKFNVRKIHDPISVVSLKTADPLYYQYFHAMSAIKTNFHVLKNLKNTHLKQSEFFDEKNILYATVIDAGKFYFEDSIDGEVAEALSETIGKRVVFDTEELRDYKVRNHEVLARYFGEDYRRMNDREFREKKLELFDMVRRGEIN